MKIGVFTDSYLPYTSGVVRSIQTFSEELSAMGHEIFIFAPSYRNCSSDEGNVFRFASIPSPTNKDFTLAVPFSLRLKPTIERLRVDLIHVHSPFLLGRLGARYSKRLGVPLVFTFHTLYDQYVHYVPFAKSFTRELAQKISKDFCNQCDLVLTPTAVISNYLRDIGVRTGIKSVPTGIKIKDVQKVERGWLRGRFNIPADAKVLLFVGRLGQEKNIGFLLECFSRLIKDHPHTQLVLVGGGPEEDFLKKKAAEMGVAEFAVFTGTLTPEEVFRCYVDSDLFVFSSVTETQGLVIAEAKSAGLPVVAVNAFGVAEMVEDGVDGFLTLPRQEDFTNKVSLLLKDDGLRRNMGSLARVNAEKLSSANCAKKLVDCYKELLSAHQKKIPEKPVI